MEKVYTPFQMKEIEQHTYLKRKMTDQALILEAGQASCRVFLSEMKPKKSAKILVFAGPGNNGLDALAFAEELTRTGLDASLLSVGKKTSDSSKVSFKRTNIISAKDLHLLMNDLNESDYIIDGLFGTGLNRDIEGLYIEVVDAINKSAKPVYSIDIPSGIDGLNGLVRGSAIKATLCGAIGFLKSGNLLGDALDYSQRTIIVPIDFRIPPTQKGMDYVEEEILPSVPRLHHTHKYQYGNVLTIGGSPGMFGSVQLSAMGALRTGCGLSTIAIQKKDSQSFSLVYPELIIKTYDTIYSFGEIIRNYDAFLFGPGMLPSKNTWLYLEKLLEQHKPLVIDASGLDLVSKLKGKKNHDIILTPHAGELARMCGITSKEVNSSPFSWIESWTNQGFIVVLKGPITILSNQEQTILIRSGNPGMATAGMGDVLAGIILGYTQKKIPLFEAVRQAIILHSMSGNSIRNKLGEEGLIASDLFAAIPKIIKQGDHS